jgi:tryptophan synthase alpha chain
MSRIEEKFKKLKADGRKGFIPFVTPGDPTLEDSLAIVLKLAELGADVIELGVPFSDPMADGPTIQLSSQRALENCVNLSKILDLIREARKTTDVPIVLFSYLNPLLNYSLRKLANDASTAGVDGVLITDVIGTEAKEIGEMLQTQNLALISLIAPTTTDERLESIAKTSSGFLYAVSRAGVTGARTEMSSDAEKLVHRARKFTGLPIAVGFGISTREQIEDVWRYADAAVVGSAIVAEIAKAEKPGEAVDRVDECVRGFLPQFAKTDMRT